jgi:hypothetical protein
MKRLDMYIHTEKIEQHLSTNDRCHKNKIK